MNKAFVVLMRGAVSHLRALLLGADPKMRRHLRFVLFSAYFYAVCVGVNLQAVYLGVVPHDSGLLLSGASVLLWLSVFSAIRLGLTRRLADPSVTYLHCLLGLGLQVWAYAMMGPTRATSLFLLSQALVFMMFRLTPRQIVSLVSLVVLAMSAAMLAVHLQSPQAFPAAIAWGHFGLMIICLPTLVIIGANVSRIRLRLLEQRARLKTTLRQLERLATRDGLTGLVSRGHMQRLLDMAGKAPQEAAGPISLALLDIDCFKSINDIHGHRVGDEVLQRFASALSQRLRASDVMARWGGEEFLLLLPGTRLDDACKLVDALRQVLSAPGLVPHVPGLAVTMSAGVAQVGTAEPIQQALERADRALYQAKAEGRNRCMRAIPSLRVLGQSMGRASHGVGRMSSAANTHSRAAVRTLQVSANRSTRAQPDTPPGHDAPPQLGWLSGWRRRWDRMTRIMLGTEPRMRLRMTILMSVMSVYAGCCVLAYWGASQGLIKPAFADRLLWAAVLTQAAFFIATRSGWVARVKDSSLMMAQNVLSVALITYAYTQIVSEQRGLVLLIISLVATFGMYTLSPRQAIFVGVTATLSLGAAMLVLSHAEPGFFRPELELLRFQLLAGIMPALTLTAHFITSFRESLKREQSELRRALARVQQMADHDALTGLVNRRHMQDLLEQRCADSAQQLAGSATSHCVVLIDLDHFKRINDSYGHQIGDEVLRAFSQAAQANLRSTDVIGRWGGEEFLILFANTTLSEAREVLRQISEALESLQVCATVPDLRVRFSAGVAEHRLGYTLDQTLEGADRALYRAKAEGRNRSLVACIAEGAGQAPEGEPSAVRRRPRLYPVA